MAIDQQITCDLCGAEKRETNHWLVAVETAPASDYLTPAIGFAPIAFIPENRDDAEIKHICGQACAHTLLSQWLDSLNATPTERPTS